MRKRPQRPAAQEAGDAPGCRDGKRAQRQRYRGGQHQAKGGEHPDQQVLEHVAPQVGVREANQRRRDGNGKETGPDYKSGHAPAAPTAAAPPLRARGGQIGDQKPGNHQQRHRRESGTEVGMVGRHLHGRLSGIGYSGRCCSRQRIRHGRLAKRQPGSAPAQPDSTPGRTVAGPRRSVPDGCEAPCGR